MRTRATVSGPTLVGLGGAAATLAGFGLLILGAFLPWVRSGTELRNSFEMIRVLRVLKVLDEGDPWQLVLDGWTLLLPIVAVCIGIYALGLHRTAAMVSTIVAIGFGTIAGIATVLSSGEDASLDIAGTGPTVTLIGALLAVAGAVAVFAGRRTSVTESAGEEP